MPFIEVGTQQDLEKGIWMWRCLSGLFFVVFVAMGVAGCDSELGSTTDSDVASEVVTVIGDDTAPMVIAQLLKHGIRTASTLDGQSDSVLIVVVQDSTVGPLPVHLEIARSLQKRPTEDYVWVFTNTAMVDDQELLELEELECRELFNSQGLPGDDIMFGFDSSTALVRSDYDCPRGWDAIVRYIESVSH